MNFNIMRLVIAWNRVKNNQTLLHMASSKGLYDIVQMCITQVQNSILNTLEENEVESKMRIQAYLHVIFLNLIPCELTHCSVLRIENKRS